MALAVKKDMLVTLSVRMADMSGKILEESGPEGLTCMCTGAAVDLPEARGCA